MKDDGLTQASFDRLLDWLGDNRDCAGNKYEKIRGRLIMVFACRGCLEAEDLADETINRVTRKLPEIQAAYRGDPARYFYGVANKVHLEYSRKGQQLWAFVDQEPTSAKPTLEEVSNPTIPDGDPSPTCQKPATRPPINAEYILYLLLRKEDRDAVIGDLSEEYGKIVKRFNKRRADLWYYKQVVSFFLPLLRRGLLKIGALVWLGRMLQRLIS